MKLIELKTIARGSATPHHYSANGRRIGREAFDRLTFTSQHTDTFLTQRRAGNWLQFKTVRVAA